MALNEWPPMRKKVGDEKKNNENFKGSLSSSINQEGDSLKKPNGEEVFYIDGLGEVSPEYYRLYNDLFIYDTEGGKEERNKKEFYENIKDIDLKIKKIISIFNNNFNDIEELEEEKVKEIIDEIIIEYIFKLSYTEQFQLLNNQFFLDTLEKIDEKNKLEINVEFKREGIGAVTTGTKEYFLKRIGELSDNQFIDYTAWIQTKYFDYYVDDSEWYWDEMDEVWGYSIPESIDYADIKFQISRDYYYVDNDNLDFNFLKIIGDVRNPNIKKKLELVSFEDILRENIIFINKNNIEAYKIFYSSEKMMKNMAVFLDYGFVYSLNVKNQFKFLDFLLESGVKEKVERIKKILSDSFTENEFFEWKKRIENNFNISINDENLSYIHFSGDGDDYVEIRKKNEWLIDTEFFLKSFLATSGDLDFGENILKIGETYPPEIANLIFEKYAEFAEITDSIEETLKNEFGVVGDNQEMISEIRDNILKTAKNLLKKYSQDDITDLDLEEIKKELSETKAELSLFVSAFKNLKECGEACSLENIKSIILEKKKGLDLLEDKKLLDEMEKIYQENYPNELGFSDEFRKKLIKGLEEKVEKDKVEFFVIKFKDELIGFNSFEFKSDDEIEFANFNMKNGAKGGKIGEALLEESLYKYAEKYKIKAVTLTDSKVFDYYTNKLGFKVLENTRREFLGREIVEIELDRRKGD